MSNIDEIRKRCWHFLNADVAAAAGMASIDELKQFIAGTFTPSPEQLEKLSRRMGLS
jgi:hypothetical protein